MGRKSTGERVQYVDEIKVEDGTNIRKTSGVVFVCDYGTNMSDVL